MESDGLRPDFDLAQVGGKVTAKMRLPLRARSPLHLEDAASGLSLAVSLKDARDVAAEVADGYVVYPGGGAQVGSDGLASPAARWPRGLSQLRREASRCPGGLLGDLGQGSGRTAPGRQHAGNVGRGRHRLRRRTAVPDRGRWRARTRRSRSRAVPWTGACRTLGEARHASRRQDVHRAGQLAGERRDLPGGAGPALDDRGPNGDRAPGAHDDAPFEWEGAGHGRTERHHHHGAGFSGDFRFPRTGTWTGAGNIQAPTGTNAPRRLHAAVQLGTTGNANTTGRVLAAGGPTAVPRCRRALCTT